MANPICPCGCALLEPKGGDPRVLQKSAMTLWKRLDKELWKAAQRPKRTRRKAA